MRILLINQWASAGIFCPADASAYQTTQHMNKFFLLSLCALTLTPLQALAQSGTTVPALNEMAGDYVIINSKVYEDVTSISEVRDMSVKVTDDDSLLISHFYMLGGLDFKAGYNASTGNITIKAGTQAFGYSDGQGSVQYLYAWDDEKSEVMERPITYRYQGNGVWQAAGTIVLMTGTAGGTDFQPYIFSQGSKMARSNATTSNVTYDGDAVRFEEKRPSYVEMKDDRITVYNLLQKDGYGYGCWVTFNYDEAAKQVSAAPLLIGSATAIDWPYKALTGCGYDETTHRPTEVSYKGTDREGVIDGSCVIDDTEGMITLNPMAVWPAKYDESGWQLDFTRFFEVEESVSVSFDAEKAVASGISLPKDGAGQGVPVSTDYYDLLGTRVIAPQHGQIVLKRMHYSDGTVRTVKELVP